MHGVKLTEQRPPIACYNCELYRVVGTDWFAPDPFLNTVKLTIRNRRAFLDDSLYQLLDISAMERGLEACARRIFTWHLSLYVCLSHESVGESGYMLKVTHSLSIVMTNGSAHECRTAEPSQAKTSKM